MSDSLPLTRCFAPLNGTSFQLESFRSIGHATALFGFTVYNSGPAQWIWVFDTQGAPASTSRLAVPPLAIAAASNIAAYYGQPIAGHDGAIFGGRAFDSGIVLANSTSGTSYSAGQADCFFDIQYL